MKETATLLCARALVVTLLIAYAVTEVTAQNSSLPPSEEAGRKVDELLTGAQRLRAEGRTDEAESLLRRALSISEKELGPGSSGVAYSLLELAVLKQESGDSKEAEKLYLRSLAVAEKALAPDHPDLAVFLNNLATLYVETGDYGKAEPLYRRALANVEKSFGPEDPATLRSVISLASIYETAADIVRAEPLLKRALAICEKTFGPNHPHVAEVLVEFAALYERKGDHAQARLLAQRALSSIDSSLGPEDVLRRKGRVLDAVSNQISALCSRADSEDRALLEPARRAELQGGVPHQLPRAGGVRVFSTTPGFAAV